MKKFLTLLPAASLFAIAAFCVAYWLFKIEFAESIFYACLFVTGSLVSTLFRDYLKRKNNSSDSK